MEESAPSDDPEGLPSDFWKQHQNLENTINHSNEESEESYFSPFDSTNESDLTDDFHFSSNPSTPSLSPATSPVYHSNGESTGSCPNLLQNDIISIPIIPNATPSLQHNSLHNFEPSIVGPVKITAIYKPDFGYLIDPKTKRPAKQQCQHCNKWISPKKGKKHIIMDRSASCCLEYDYCSHCTIRANKWKGKITVLYSHASSVPIDFIFVDTKAGCDHRIQCEKCGQHKFCFSSHTCKKKEHTEFNGSYFPKPEPIIHSTPRTKSESAPSLYTPVASAAKVNSGSFFHNNNNHWNNHPGSILSGASVPSLQPGGPHNSFNGSHAVNNGLVNNSFVNNNNVHNHNGNYNHFIAHNGNSNFMSHPDQLQNHNQFPNDHNQNRSDCDPKNLSHQIANLSSKMLTNSLLKQQLQLNAQDQNKKLTPSEEMLYEVWSTEFGSKEKIDESLLNQLLRKIHVSYDLHSISLPTLASWKSFMVAKIVVSTDNHLHFKTFEEWFGRLGPSYPENHSPLWCWTFFLERVAQFADAVHLCKKTMSHSLRLVKSKDQKDAITLCWSPDHGEVEKRFRIKCGEDGFSLYKDSAMRVFSYRDHSLEKIILKFIEEHS